MKIGLVAMHSFPLPFSTHTGDIVILDLARSLKEIGHQVHLYAPEGSVCEDIKVYPMPCSYGKFPPKGEDCEQQCFDDHKETLMTEDIVHDFSVSKRIVENLYKNGHKGIISTIMGGPWTQNIPPHNLIVWSDAHRDRVLRGATDYENTPTPDLAGPPKTPVKEAKVVYGGIDTNLYNPTYNKKDYILWMGRWSKVRGYIQAIEIAKANPNVKFIFSGGMPEHEYFEQEKNCALEAIELIKNISNIELKLLPPGPDHHTFKIKLYQEAKAFLYNVQFNEPFGMMQAESLACGTPVIGTNYGSIPEIVTNGITGFVRQNTIENLTTAIDMIDMIKPEVCRNIAIQRFDRHVMAKSYLDKYNDILNSKGWS